jgi:hypothetical protein
MCIRGLGLRPFHRRAPVRPRVQKLGTKTLSVDYHDCSQARRARDGPGRNHKTSRRPTMRCLVREAVRPSNSAWSRQAVRPCVNPSIRRILRGPSGRQSVRQTVEPSNRAFERQAVRRAFPRQTVRRAFQRQAVRRASKRQAVKPSFASSRRQCVGACVGALFSVSRLTRPPLASHRCRGCRGCLGLPPPCTFLYFSFSLMCSFRRST